MFLSIENLIWYFRATYPYDTVDGTHPCITWDVYINPWKIMGLTTNLNWWVYRISEPSTSSSFSIPYSKGKVGYPWESTKEIYNQHIPPLYMDSKNGFNRPFLGVKFGGSQHLFETHLPFGVFARASPLSKGDLALILIIRGQVHREQVLFQDLQRPPSPYESPHDDKIPRKNPLEKR